MDKMKKTILILLVLVAQSCGKSKGGSSSPGACSSFAQLGEWDDRNFSSIVSIKADCTATDQRCESKMTYSPASDYSTSGNVSFTISENNGALSCIPNGTYDCNTNGSTSSYLRITCTGIAGTLEFDKQ